MEHARLISIAQKVIHTFGKDRQLTLCCTVYSRARSITLRPGQSARSIRGRGVIKEMRYVVHTKSVGLECILEFYDVNLDQYGCKILGFWNYCTLRLLLLAGTNFSVLVVCCIWQVLILTFF